MSIELSEQEVLRRQSLKALRELGINPYPAARFEVNASAREIAEQFDPEKGNFQQVSIAGRIMSRRIMGSASFFELQDATGRIQVYIRRDDICPEGDPTLYNTVFKKLLDIGDFIGVEVSDLFELANQPLFQTLCKMLCCQMWLIKTKGKGWWTRCHSRRMAKQL